MSLIAPRPRLTSPSELPQRPLEPLAGPARVRDCLLQVECCKIYERLLRAAGGGRTEHAMEAAAIRTLTHL